MVATTKRQAQIVFDKAKRMVLADPLLRATTKVYRQVLEIPETGAIFRVLPWDADTTQGLHPTACVIDEYHVHRDCLDARGHALRHGRQRQRPPDHDLHGRPGAQGAALGPPAQRPEGPSRLRLLGRRDRRRGRPRPQGVAARQPLALDNPEDAARPVPHAALPGLRAPPLEPLPLERHQPRLSGRLVAPRRRAPGLRPQAAHHPRPGRLLDARLHGAGHGPAPVRRPILLWAQVWTMDKAMGHIDHEAVEAKIVELCHAYNVIRIGCDPNYFTRSMLKLEHELGLPVEEFPQENKRMTAASMTLYDVLQEGRLIHGADPVLTEHVLNAAIKPTPHGWRITKVEDSAKIDAAVAAAIAVYLAEAEADTFAPSFAETGGVWTIDG